MSCLLKMTQSFAMSVVVRRVGQGKSRLRARVVRVGCLILGLFPPDT
jgi:hypothetical protein